MRRYLLRRLLLMVPTLWGVTLVSFAIMQLAPGDPLLNRGDAQGGQRQRSREAYLVQKRALGLDRPPIVNLLVFQDYTYKMRAAAWCLGTPAEELAEELPRLIVTKGDSTVYRSFLTSLDIPEFEARLADRSQHLALARAAKDFAQVWCENTGRYAVPAAMRLLADPFRTLTENRGAIHALNSMLADPFVYVYSRDPSEDETPAVLASWSRYAAFQSSSLPPVSAERTAELAAKLKSLADLDSRSELMAGLETLDRADAQFFLTRLLAPGTELEEQSVCALVLRLFLGKPLRVDVSPTADIVEVHEVASNWLGWYEAHRDDFEFSFPRRLANAFTDTQYAMLVGRLVTFDFGRSALPTREPVGHRIWRAVRVSAPLMFCSEALIYLIAVPLGIMAAVYRGRLVDRAISTGLFVLYSVPTFVAAMVLLLLFCYGTVWKVFPMSGLHSNSADEMSLIPWLLDYAWHATLPIVCLSLFSLAGMAMYSRSSMLDCLGEDYLRTARAKGVSERLVIWRHAPVNALIPLVTLFADFLPAMLGGSVLVEVLFAIPGMGRLSWASIEQKDYPTLMALVYLDAILVLLSILLSDLLYWYIDPRVSLDTPPGDD